MTTKQPVPKRGEAAFSDEGKGEPGTLRTRAGLLRVPGRSPVRLRPVRDDRAALPRPAPDRDHDPAGQRREVRPLPGAVPDLDQGREDDARDPLRRDRAPGRDRVPRAELGRSRRRPARPGAAEHRPARQPRDRRDDDALAAPLAQPGRLRLRRRLRAGHVVGVGLPDSAGSGRCAMPWCPTRATGARRASSATAWSSTTPCSAARCCRTPAPCPRAGACSRSPARTSSSRRSSPGATGRPSSGCTRPPASRRRS